MNICITEKLPPVGSVCAIGNFDGVHPGHRRLFDICRRIADESGAAVCALTFDGLEKDGGRLISLADRESYLKQSGVDTVLSVDFDSVKNMTPREFAEEYLMKKLSPSAVVCGEDFRFGRGAAGNAETLRELMGEYGIPVHVAETEMLDGAAVSTSRVKSALGAGDAEYAARLLGREYSIAYPVREGKHLGRTIGAPTINQHFTRGMFIPKFGVYATKTDVHGEVYPSVTNVGIRPTVDDGDAITAETYIIGYEGDLYGETVRVHFVRYLRGEAKFDSVEALAEQIAKDADEALGFF